MASNDDGDSNRKAKKRRISPEESQPETSEAPGGSNEGQFLLLDLPPELLRHILGFLNFEHVAKARGVCRTFYSECASILNSEFQRLCFLLEKRYNDMKAEMPRRESSRRSHPRAMEFDIIQALRVRLSLLDMTYTTYIDKGACCFFPGEVLDEIHRILRYVETQERLKPARTVAHDLLDLSNMAMEYFREQVLPLLGQRKDMFTLTGPPSNFICFPVKEDSETKGFRNAIKKLRCNTTTHTGEIGALNRLSLVLNNKVNTHAMAIDALKAQQTTTEQKLSTALERLDVALQELADLKASVSYVQVKCGFPEKP